MAGGFWKSLVSKVVDTGAAYLQQVRVVNELKGLAPGAARLRFAEYVLTLSSTARAGFAVTLAALANIERNAEAKRLIESLRVQLTNPHERPESLPAAPPAASACPSFEEDLQRVSEWHDIQGDQRAEIVGACLNSLDLAGLESLHANLAQMQINCATNLKNHRDNEARIAAGRFIEDQHNYLALLLAGGPHDPGWLEQLGQFEEWGRWFETVHEVVGKLAGQRRQSPAPSAPPPTAPERSDGLRQIDALRTMLEQKLASGEVRGERAVSLRRTLDKLESLLSAHDRGEIGAEATSSRTKQLMGEIASLVADPGSAKRTPGTPRAREVDAYAGAMKTALMREIVEVSEATKDALNGVLGDLLKFQNAVAGVSDDDALAQLESQLLRPAARTRHEVAMGRHALVARPLWQSVEYLPAVNTVAYSGGADLQQQLESALAPRRLTVSSAKRTQNFGQVRWDELNTSHVAFFDLRGAGAITALATEKPRRARELAGTAYELGLAFALGKPVVVASSAGETMPFDLDLSPLSLEGDDDDAALLVQAVDEAFYLLQRSGRDSSVRDSIAFLDRLTADHPRRTAIEGMGWLDPELANDHGGFVAKADQVLRMLPPPPWRLLRPAWPAAYPDAAAPRCFHVMPFGPAWADGVRDIARAACEERGYIYRRGDEAEEGRIVHAIWDDLCRASVILVDLSGANLNVMIELGIAHAIGRPVLAVRRSDTVDVRPKHIEKIRVLEYGSDAELKKLLQSRLKP